MQVVISNRIQITEPTEEIKNFCRTKLVIDNPEFYTLQRLGKYVGRTPRTLDLYARDGINWYLPYGTWQKVRGLIPVGTPVSTDIATNPKVEYGAKAQLYDYQVEAVKAMQGKDCGIIEAPCGSGKTQMGLGYIIESGLKALWLTHTKDLLDQSKERAESLGVPKHLIGTITAGKVNISSGITFATVQTMQKIHLPDYKYSWDLVIVDECHRAAGTPTRYTQFSKVISALAAPRKYGLSATVSRADGLIDTVFALLGETIHTVSEEAVKDKTCEVTVQQVNTGVGISPACLDTDGTMMFTKLVGYLAEHPDRNKLIAQNLYENRAESNLILSDRLANLRGLIDCIKALGIPSDQIRMIDGSMVSKKAKKERQQAIKDMQEGKAKYLFASYNLAKEGLDIPRLNRLHLVTPHKHEAIILQCIGRIGRAAPNKGEAIAYDYIDAIGYTVNAGKTRRTAYNKKGCKVNIAKIQQRQDNQSSFLNFASF